jgi:hypothetical protein
MRSFSNVFSRNCIFGSHAIDVFDFWSEDAYQVQDESKREHGGGGGGGAQVYIYIFIYLYGGERTGRRKQFLHEK